MNNFLKGSLLKGVLLFCSLHGLCQQDSIQKIADPRLKTTDFRTFLMGENYRGEWLEPVKARVVDLKKLHITSVKEGGGKELDTVRHISTAHSA